MNILIVGAGPVGSSTAALLAEQGHTVKVATRSGKGPSHANIRCISLDATNGEQLTSAATGTETILNCVNPPYTEWDTQWPAFSKAFNSAAERTGAALVTMSNLYGHGPSHTTMTGETGLDATGKKGLARAEAWREAIQWHNDGRIRTAEVRASDFFGPLVVDANMGDRVVPNILDGKPVRLLGKVSQPHSFSYMPDVARTLAAVATTPSAFGKAWIVPSTTTTQGDLVTQLAAAANRQPPKISTLPHGLLRVAGLFVPLMRELLEVEYQFAAPFVADGSATTSQLGITTTPLDEACQATIRWWTERRGEQKSQRVSTGPAQYAK